MFLLRKGDMVIADAVCSTLSTAGVLLEHSNAACGTQMPLAEALEVSSPDYCARAEAVLKTGGVLWS